MSHEIVSHFILLDVSKNCFVSLHSLSIIDFSFYYMGPVPLVVGIICINCVGNRNFVSKGNR